MPLDLAGPWRSLADAGLNNRAIAARLRVSEAQLVASGCGTLSVRLVPDAFAILEAARRLGTVKWVVRNDFAVLERRGGIARLECGPGDVLRVDAGTATVELGADRIASAFALAEPRPREAKRSLQLFDASGVSVVKLVAASAEDFGTVVNSLRHQRQSRRESAELLPRDAVPGLLRRGALDRFLHRASEFGTPLDIRVCNSAASIDVLSPVKRIKRSDRAAWINVLDPELEIHLHEARIRGLRFEPHALHWYSDSGEPAFSVGCGTDFEPLARAAGACEEIPHSC